MEHEFAADSEGEESLDSIPRPEYEAIEMGAASTQSSPTVTDPLSPKELQVSRNDENMLDVQSEDRFSEKAALSAQDLHDLDITAEKLKQDPGNRLENNEFKDNNYKDACAKILPPTHSAATGLTRTDFTAAEEALVKHNPETLETTPHKLMQAKTKDNKYLLVQLIDENGKTLRPPVRNINKSDITAVPTARAPFGSVAADVATNTAHQIRSSTPISREFLALQKSVNESKILTEFVTDIAVEKARKRKPTTPAKDNSSAKNERQTSLDIGTSKVRRKSNTSDKLNTSAEHVTADSLLQMAGSNVKPENSTDSTISYKAKHTTETQKAAMNCPVPMTAAIVQKYVTEKSRKSGTSKFVPLKDESSSYQSDAGSSSSVKRRSRSKSVSRKSPAVSDFDSMPGKLKRWPSDEKSLKRTNMRSQNSEFVQKQIDFLHRVIRQEDENNDEEEDDENDDGMLSLEEQQLNANNANADADDAESQLATALDNAMNESGTFLGNFVGNTSDNSTSQAQVSNGSHTKTLEKYLESIYEAPPRRGWDSFCWKCRQGVDLLSCSKCLRCFHATCIKITSATKLDKTWTCPECVAVEHVLNGPKRTRRNELSLDLLSQLLSFALKRMRNVKGLPQFLQSSKNFAKLSKYFVNPVTFDALQEKIEKKVFRCAEEFVNETKWMQHNTLIAAAGTNSKDSITAKAILKICRQEANEIDTCPECYLNANTRSDWFVDVCSQPHLLLWAKLKGFPYWPAKAMGLGQGSHVNVRFFGQHDRAFVPIKDCYLFSEQVPNALSGKRSARAGFAECIQEVEVHIEKIKSKVGAFNYAPYKTLYDPTAEMQQLELLMPGVQEFMKRQQSVVPQKPPLQYKIVKTADNHLSIVKKGTSTADSGTESDHSFGVTTGTAGTVVTATMSSPPGKKKSPERSEATADHSKLVKIATTSNYEVIHKISNDESNSSKVSAVILKRKAEHAEHRKAVDGGADSDLPLPKMTKIEENNEELLPPRDVIEKCKLNEESAETSKESSSENLTSKVLPKHSKTEPKVPILTIKTNVNKVFETNQSNETGIGTVEGVETSNETTKVQSTVENLVKYKQGVTIKKLTKEDVRKKQAGGNNHTEKQAAVTKQTATSESADTTKVTIVEQPQKDSNKCNKPPIPPKPPQPPPVESQPQQPPLVIKDLVPFVEIKKEVSSDDDEETVVENEKPVTVIAVAATSSGSESTAVPAITKPTLIAVNTAEKTVVLPIAAPLPEVVPTLAAPLIDSVKKEILSDDDEVIAVSSATDATKTSLIPVEKPVDAATTVIVAQLATPAEAVRVVGDTTIQRVSAKVCTSTTSLNQTQATALQFQASTSNAATSTLPMTGSIFTGLAQTTTTNMLNASKRNAMRGIPHGPLPASAAATSAVRTQNNSETEKHQSQPQHKIRPDVQRARKSFPNRSPTEVSPVRCGDVTPPTLPAVAVVNVTDPKRSLTKTSMVSIPVDVATSRGNSTAVIPVPPLTAVTKVIPTTTTTSSTLSAVSSNAVSTSVTTFLNCNGSTQITMSAPPPLAGLSYSTLTSTPSTVTLTSTPNVQLLNGSSLDSSAGNTHSYNADTHPIGDFVTPTLASAITDAICRGPPRMTPRPNGPLQSDGSTMFPSQAGPVCRTLVENAHKLTDFFISVMEDTMCEMSVGDESVLQAKITLLTMELERTKQTYECEIAELKRTSDLMLCEMRKSMETEKSRIAADVRKQCELERKRSVEETKKKQWCANCGRESQFHCCWNTSYCDYPCQQLHWSRHAASCAQTRPSSNETSLQSIGVNTSTHMERHHANSKSSFTTISTNSTAHYNNKSGMANKKDKTVSKVTTSSISNAMSTGLPAAEVLKLPNNTYLRPVTSTANVRTPFPPQTPVQRFNIPLPIAAPANPGLPYTLVQREGNWELMSALTPTVAATNTSSVNTITINTSQQQQTRLGTTSATMSTKTAARSRVNTSAVTMQSHSSNMTGSLQSSGALRSTQM